MFNSYQEAFDVTIEGLAKQGKQAYNLKLGICTYLDNLGNKCAVGLHIPDGHPAQRRSCGVRMLISDSPDLENILMIQGELNMDFWVFMQNAHDMAASLHQLIRAYKEIASLYNLDTSKLSMFTSWEIPTQSDKP